MSTPSRCRIWFTYAARQPNWGPFQPWCQCGNYRAQNWYTTPHEADLASKNHLALMTRKH